MSTRSGAEFRASSAMTLPDDMPEWAKSIIRSQDETNTQLEFLMTQLLDLKTAKTTEIYPLVNAVGGDSPPPPANGGQTTEHHWDAAKKGAKPEVTAFDGSLDPKRYMDWEAGLDEYFDWYQLPENRRVQFAQMKLTGKARIYWQNLQATMERRHEPMISSWAEMKSRLRIKFVPTCYRPMILDEWQHLRQGEGSVADYIARFDDLMIRCNVDEEPMATLVRFWAGLRSEFQRELVLQEVSTLEKAYQYTINMEIYTAHNQGGPTPWLTTTEAARYHHMGPRPPLPVPLPPVHRQSVASTPLPIPSKNPSITPNTNTGNRLGPPTGPYSPRVGVQPTPANEITPAGRISQGPRPRPPPLNSTGARVACYKCQGWGHLAAQCPSSRQTTRPARALLVEVQDEEQPAPAYFEDAYAETYEADPELALAFEGSPTILGCIIKEVKPLTTTEHSRALTTPLGTMLSDMSADVEEAIPGTKDPLCSAIFSTFTTIGSTVVKILVDSGSVVNAVAAASVHTLGLLPRPHPPPYKAMWVNEASLAVTKRCIVPLKVAGYREDIWCDILPMGVGSVLLGRPWLYDRDVAQHGRTNRCTFHFGGVKQIWQPFIPPNPDIKEVAEPSEILRPPGQYLGIVSARQFFQDVSHDAPCGQFRYVPRSHFSTPEISRISCRTSPSSFRRNHPTRCPSIGIYSIS